MTMHSEFKIRLMPIAELTPAPYNPREMLEPGDPAYRKLENSLREFGLVEPLIWNQRTGYLVGGHMRLTILRRQVVDTRPDGRLVPQPRWIKYGSRVLLSIIEEPDLETALKMLADGDGGKLLPYLPDLLGRSLPLLELANRQLELDLGSMLQTLRERLGIVK